MTSKVNGEVNGEPVMSAEISTAVVYRQAEARDLKPLLSLERSCFETDRLSERSFRHWIRSQHGCLLVAEQIGEHNGSLLGYGLLWCHRGTRLARLYSIATAPEARGKGVAQGLLTQLEEYALEQGRLFLRLEVAKGNDAAIALYLRMGYHVFGEYHDYYDDHRDALRMQKQIRQRRRQSGSVKEKQFESVLWYQQTTDFTCGPASLMMAMHKVDSQVQPDRALELDLWREATTIFMTSGHGGCHPLGLALAAARRGFEADVYLNTRDALFLDGVRSEEKKDVMTLVHAQFVERCQASGICVHYEDILQTHIANWLEQGCGVLVLISTYRLDGKKTPHWVMVTDMDDECFYVHDPDVDEDQQPLDCQYLPIARDDFEKMSAFGNGRLRTALAISRKS